MNQHTSTPTSKEELLARLRAQRERTLYQLGNAGGTQPPAPVPPAQPEQPEQPAAIAGNPVALAMLAKKAAALRAQQEAAAEAERIANLPPPKAPELACTPELRERCP